ncbi:hypothetical protein IJM86_06385 [bacterium]|nr:hypothetical protein [bacterium]
MLIIGLGYCAYLYGYATIGERSLVALREESSQLQQQNATFFQDPLFEKFSFSKKLENENFQMPWSDHIEKVSRILEDITDVGTGSYNIILEDFQISLESISLKGSVSSLRVLYNMSNNANAKKPLLQRFQELEFLKDIAIQTYDKKNGELGYSFVLTAKVENNYDK